jgi:hypothetical protein
MMLSARQPRVQGIARYRTWVQISPEFLQDVTDISKARTWYGSSDMKAVMEKSGIVGSPSIRAAAQLLA